MNVLGENGRNYVMKNFNRDIICGNFLNFISENCEKTETAY